MSYPVKNGQTSVVLRFKLLDSTSTTGAGLTGLTSASAGLIISTIADNEAAAVAYTQAGGTIEGITTLGTYAAPTATKCRFKEVDATNHKGIYEFQFADARFAVANAKSLLISVSGAGSLAQVDYVVPLTVDDPYLAKLTAAQIATGVWQDAVAGDFTTASSIGKSLYTSGVVPGGTNGLFIAGTNAATTITTGLTAHFIGTVDVVTTYTGNTPQTGDGFARLGAPAGASVSADIAAVKTDTAAIKLKTDNLPSDPADESLIIAATDAIMTRIGVPAGASVSADIVVITGRLPAALVGGRMDSSTGAMAVDVITNSALAASAITEIQTGLATSASIVTAQADLDDIQTRLPAALVGGRMDSSVGAMAANVLTASALASDAVVEIQNGLAMSYEVGAIASDVWDEQVTDHLGAGSTGAALNAAGSAGDPWTTPLPGAYGAGTAGSIVGNNLDVAVSTRLATAGYTAPDNASIAAIKLKTDNLPPDPADESLVIAATTAIFDRIGAPAGASVSADVAVLQADTDNIQTRLPAALVGGRMDSSVGAMAVDVITAASLAADAVTEIQTGLATSAAVAALPTAAQNADAFLVRNIAGGSDGGRDVTSALRVLRNRFLITAGAPPVRTIYEEDDVTPAWTSLLAIDAAAVPIVGDNPV